MEAHLGRGHGHCLLRLRGHGLLGAATASRARSAMTAVIASSEFIETATGPTLVLNRGDVQGAGVVGPPPGQPPAAPTGRLVGRGG
jgi:hypothetical protein